jgi:hypothetical protein
MSDSRKERRFKVYQSLLLALKRAGVGSHGCTATLLLETFLEDNGRLQASKVVSRRICEEGAFSNWRNDMIRNGWLVWSSNQTDKGQYFAGKKLIPYLNKEKISSRELATRDEVASKSEFEELKERVSTIEQSMKTVYAALDLGETDPPLYGKLQKHARKARKRDEEEKMDPMFEVQ